MSVIVLGSAVLGVSLLLAACSGKPTASDESHGGPKSGSMSPSDASRSTVDKSSVAPTPKAPLTSRAANPTGKVFVAMYHHLGDRKDPMFRSVTGFQHDLQTFVDLGFYPVTATEYVTNKMPLPPGATPVVMTFDDSNPDQIRLLPDGSLDPTCFLGIWDSFAKTHPNFPIRATFFVLPDVMFGQHKFLQAKLDLIKGWGCELGNHTMTHPILRKKSDAEVEQEIGDASLALAKLGQPGPDPLALPFGVSPRNRELLKGFDWQGKPVALQGVFLVGANPAPAPTDPKFNPTSIPRIQANDGELGLTYWLNKVQESKVKLYVSG